MMSSDIQNASFLTPQPGLTVMEPGTKHVILSISLVLIQLFGIFGNTMLFLVVYRKPHLRTRTNIFILNLACADLGVATLCMPFSVVTCVRQAWIFGDALCQFNGFVNITFAMCSLLTLTAISVEKYFTIVKPLNRVMTRRRAQLMLAVTWVEPVLFASLPLTGFTRYEYKEGSSQCSVQNPASLGQSIHAGLVFLVAYIIPLSIMGFAYVKIFQTARHHERRMSHTSITSRVSTSISSQNQIALTIFIMLIVFILCWTPYFAYVAYITANHVTNDQTRDLGMAAYWCVFLNSALNPFIYGIRNPHFRASFKETFVCVTRSFCTLLGNAKKRGYSDSSTTITKPSLVSPSNSDVTPEDSCHSNGSQTPSGLRMCISQIHYSGSDEKTEGDVESGCQAHEEYIIPEDSELREKKFSDCKLCNNSLERNLKYNDSFKTPVISHINRGFEGQKQNVSVVKHLCSEECSRTLTEQNLPINNFHHLPLPRQQYESQNIPHRSTRRMLRAYSYPQTKPCIPLDTQTASKMATRMRSQRQRTHAYRKSTGKIQQSRDLNLKDRVMIGSDFGTRQSQPICKIIPSKETGEEERCVGLRHICECFSSSMR